MTGADLSVTGRLDRSLARMRSEGFMPLRITLGELEQRQLVDWIDDQPETKGLLEAMRRTPRERVHGMKYRGATIVCSDEPAQMKVEGVWVDPVCEAELLEDPGP